MKQLQERAEVVVVVTPGETHIDAVAELVGSDPPLKVEATAPRSRWPDLRGQVARDLATARALRALEVELMHRVHEHIDRCIIDQ